MGKKAKKLRSDKKKMAKKSQKAANRAKYDAWRNAGTNSKSFRQRKKAKKKTGNNDKGKHLIHDCGNVGCLKCNPMERKPVIILGRRQTLELIRRMFPLRVNKKLEHVGGNKGRA
jgi:hypothetical protein